MTPFGFPLDRAHVPERENPLENAPHISNMLPSGNDSPIPDHAAALAEILRSYAKQIAGGRSAEDAANELLPIIRVAARRT